MQEKPQRPINEWLSLIARLILAGVWLAAGALKLPDLGSSVAAVRAYQILPYELTTIVGYALPILEIALGLLLLVGLFTRISGLVSALMMAAFVAAIASVWIRGISIDCGCFGGGGEVADAFSSYPWEILRDVALGALGGLLVVFPRTPFSLDAVLSTEMKEYEHDVEA